MGSYAHLCFAARGDNERCPACEQLASAAMQPICCQRTLALFAMSAPRPLTHLGGWSSLPSLQAFAILEMPLLFMIMRLLLLVAAFQVGE